MKRFLISLAALALAACATDQPKAAKVAETTTTASEGELSPVGVIPTALIHDAQRNKDLDISIEYPTRGGPSPVIIFSPGYGGSTRGYESTVSYWTTRGFVVIRPSHADAGAIRDITRDTAAERRDDRQQSRRERRRGEEAQAPQPPPFRPNPMETIWEKEREPQWRDRVRDITLIIDSLGDLEQRFPELQGKMDKAKIGVGGHSYGAFAAMLAGGARTFGNPPLQLGDSRVKAILLMSPPGIAANRGLTAESWRDVKIPAMFMTGSRDFGGVETETPEWRKAGFENGPAGDKYWVLIEGARHLTFTGIAAAANAPMDNTTVVPRIDPNTGREVMTEVPRSGATGYISERGTFERIRSVSLTFWDAYLKGDAKAKDRLSAGQFGSNVTMEKK